MNINPFIQTAFGAIVGGMEVLGAFIAKINASLLVEEERDEAIEPLFELCRMFLKLRQEVLRLIPHEIKQKNQQLEIDQIGDTIAMHITKYVNETSVLILKKEQFIQ